MNSRHRRGVARLFGAHRSAPILVLLLLGSLVMMAGAGAATGAPSNASPPVVTGVAQEGRTLTLQSGTWSGANPILFDYQWRRCDSTGASCTAIAGATSQTYTLTTADVGATIRALVTATNAEGSGTALSDPTAVVSGAGAPYPTTAPAISGNARQGSTLSASNGSWSGSGSLSYRYQWQRCNASGSGCSAIDGATSSSHQLVAADVGATVRVEVTATNSSGSTSSFSGSSAVIAAPGSAPANTSAPTLSGTLLEGSAVSVNQGGWSGTAPISYGYGWQRCDASGNNCAGISGATGSSYTLVRSDVGDRVRGVVTASNGAGSTTAYTALGGIVGSQREPVSTALPSIGGSAAVGQKLTATVGTWSGATPIRYYFQWARSNAKGGFDPIPAATAQTYSPTAADLGHELFVQVKAQNAYGPAWANSKPTSAIQGTAPAPGVVSVDSVALPDRLVVSKVAFAPTILRTRAAFGLRVTVKDSSGHLVQGAKVYALGLPYSWVKAGAEQQTGADGTAMLTVAPSARLPVGHRHALVMFVRARKPGGSALAGVSVRRLVEVHIR